MRYALRAAGAASASLAALALLFGAYQLWGTGLGEARAQTRLRAELRRELPVRATAGPRPLDATGRDHPVLHPSQVAPPDPVPPVPPPADGQPVGTIDIPSIGLDQVVVEGVGAADLAMGPGHYPGTPLPGEDGDVAIAGHRTTYLHPFYDLTAVAPGDPIVITTRQGIFTYVAQGEEAVTPTDTAVIGPTSTPTLTLTTCNPRYSAATRLVLKATLERSVLYGSAAASPPGQRAPGTARVHPGGPPRPPATTGVTTRRGLGPVIAWGLGVATTLAGTWSAGARARGRPARWLVRSGGVAVGLVALFFFFGALTPFLPATY